MRNFAICRMNGADGRIGSEFTQEHCYAPSERCAAGKYADTGECYASNDESRDGIRELSRGRVSPFIRFGSRDGANGCARRANENAGKLTRKTISPQDVFKALEELEFGEFVPRLEGELQREFSF